MNRSATGAQLIAAADLAREREAKYARRKVVNRVALALSLAAMAFGVFWLVWILWETLRQGIGGITWAALSQVTPAPNEPGGLANALWGSAVMVALATCVGAPVGVPAVPSACYPRFSYRSLRIFRISSVSLGTTSNRSPTIP